MIEIATLYIMTSYSQKPLIDLMKSGGFPGESGKPKHIQTVISNVFVFDDKVYKFCKNDNDFFNNGFRDISDNKERFSFTEKDYKWNDTLSPSIYIRLANVAVQDGIIAEVDRNDAEEIMQIMNKVDTNNVLYEKLISGEITKDDCFEIGKQLGESMKKVQTRLPDKGSFYEMFESRIDDLREWINSTPEYISKDEANAYCDYLNDFRLANREWFDGELTDEVVADGDFHSHNAVYSNKILYLMDTYPPKEEWGVGHKLIPLYRIGVDVWALSGNKEYFETLIAGYEAGNNIKVNRKLDDVYVIYVAGIAVPYLYMLQQTDAEKKEPAKRFHKFLSDYYKTVTKTK